MDLYLACLVMKSKETKSLCSVLTLVKCFNGRTAAGAGVRSGGRSASPVSMGGFPLFNYYEQKQFIGRSLVVDKKACFWPRRLAGI